MVESIRTTCNTFDDVHVHSFSVDPVLFIRTILCFKYVWIDMCFL